MRREIRSQGRLCHLTSERVEMAKKHLLIVANTPSDHARELTEAVIRGASNPDIEGVEVRFQNPLAATRSEEGRVGEEGRTRGAPCH